jgi:hypothetical protein
MLVQPKHYPGIATQFVNMLTQTLLFALAAAAGLSSAVVVRDEAAACTPKQRIAGGQGVIYAYAQNAPGDGGLDGKCITTM